MQEEDSLIWSLYKKLYQNHSCSSLHSIKMFSLVAGKPPLQEVPNPTFWNPFQSISIVLEHHTPRNAPEMHQAPSFWSYQNNSSKQIKYYKYFWCQQNNTTDWYQSIVGFRWPTFFFVPRWCATFDFYLVLGELVKIFSYNCKKAST